MALRWPRGSSDAIPGAPGGPRSSDPGAVAGLPGTSSGEVGLGNILLLMLLVLMTSVVSMGYLSAVGLVMLLASLVCAIWMQWRRVKTGLAPVLSATVLAMCCVASASIVTGVRHISWASFASAVGVLTAIWYLATDRRAWLWWIRFAVMIIVAVAVRAHATQRFADPKTQSFYFQTLMAHRVYHYDGPARYLPGPTPDSEWRASPPLTLVAPMLGWLVCGDVRAGWVPFDIAAALLLFATAARTNAGGRGRRLGELLAVSYLFVPSGIAVFARSNDVLMSNCMLGALVYCLVAGRGPLLTGCALGLWMGLSQMSLLAAPLLLKLRRPSGKAWGIGLAAAGALLWSFLYWRPADFQNSIVTGDLFGEVLSTALSLPGALAMFGLKLPVELVAALAAGALVLFGVKMRPTVSGWLFSTACFLLAFAFIGGRTAGHVFHAAVYALLLALAARPDARETAASESKGNGAPLSQRAALNNVQNPTA